MMNNDINYFVLIPKHYLFRVKNPTYILYNQFNYMQYRRLENGDLSW